MPKGVKGFQKGNAVGLQFGAGQVRNEDQIYKPGNVPWNKGGMEAVRAKRAIRADVPISLLCYRHFTRGQDLEEINYHTGWSLSEEDFHHLITSPAARQWKRDRNIL